jgi:hypothetical protein
MAPFMLTELAKRMAVIIQNAKERIPICQVIPRCSMGADPPSN